MSELWGWGEPFELQKKGPGLVGTTEDKLVTVFGTTLSKAGVYEEANRENVSVDETNTVPLQGKALLLVCVHVAMRKMGMRRLCQKRT